MHWRHFPLRSSAGEFSVTHESANSFNIIILKSCQGITPPFPPEPAAWMFGAASVGIAVSRSVWGEKNTNEDWCISGSCLASLQTEGLQWVSITSCLHHADEWSTERVPFWQFDQNRQPLKPPKDFGWKLKYAKRKILAKRGHVSQNNPILASILAKTCVNGQILVEV